MIKRVISYVLCVMSLWVFFLITHFSLLISPVRAEGEFSSSYNTTYDVDESGLTTVSEKITIKNLTERFYVSNFSLIIGANQISEIVALDSTGTQLPTTLTNQGKKTLINVKFNNEQVVGKGKEFTWTLFFKSKDFAQKFGKVWQVSVPKLGDVKGVENYQLILSVPVNFGDPTTILPEPVKQSESFGKINFNFNKDQLMSSGVIANFGSEQLLDFKETFSVVNNRLVSYLVKLPLPPNTGNQEIALESIIPAPENVVADEEGNLNAYFRMERKQMILVTVTGHAKLTFSKNNSKLTNLDLSKYTAAEKYWEKDSPLIQSKLNEIFKDLKDKSNTQKAKAINNYLVSFLQFDFDRIAKNDFARLGALTVLSNPEKALSAEFSDLFITLARAANIPARQLIGYAASNNLELRPLSFEGKLLHSWVEIYDPLSGWQPADPTWEVTTGGVNYFGNVDLNHLVLERIGQMSADSFTITKLETKFSDVEFISEPKTSIIIDVPDELIAGFPAKVRIQIQNRGSKYLPANKLIIKLKNLQLIPTDKIKLNEPIYFSEIPPFGVVNISFNLKSSELWRQFNDEILVALGEPDSPEFKTEAKSITVKPFFASQPVSIIVLGLALITVLFYILTLTWHIRLSRHSAKNLKS